MKRSVISRVLGSSLWRYDCVATEKLRLHHRIGSRIVAAWAWAAGTMAVCLFQICFLPDAAGSPRSVLDKATLVLAIISTAVALFLAIPAIFLLPNLEEIERALRRRGMPVLPSERAIHRLNQALVRMVWWLLLPYSLYALWMRPGPLTVAQIILWVCLAVGL